MASSKKALWFYWDANVFTKYLGNEEGSDKLADILAAIKGKPENRIVTSTLSVAEVAFVAEEHMRGKLDPDGAERLANMWRDPIIVLVEADFGIMERARELMRQALSQGYRVKGADAVHLASAQMVHLEIHPIYQMHTYEKRLQKYSSFLSVPIREPDFYEPTQRVWSDVIATPIKKGEEPE